MESPSTVSATFPSAHFSHAHRGMRHNLARNASFGAEQSRQAVRPAFERRGPGRGAKFPGIITSG